MKFKSLAFKMRITNQETLNKIRDQLNIGYSAKLLENICKIMSEWQIKQDEVINEKKTFK